MANATIDIAAACQGGASELAAAWQRAFGIAVKVEPGTAAEMSVPLPPVRLATSGLLLHLKGESQQCWFAVPHHEAILAPWFTEAFETGKAKLADLAKTLARLLLGSGAAQMQPAVQAVDNLLETLVGFFRGYHRLMSMPCTIALQDGETATEAFLAWNTPEVEGATTIGPSGAEPAAGDPSGSQDGTGGADQTGHHGQHRQQDAHPAPDEPVASAQAAAHPAAGANQPASQREGEAPVPALAPSAQWPGGEPSVASVRSLPPYSRSLLKIRVPVSVTLARKKQRASQVMELCPGAIIQFDRSCEEALDLEVGGHRIAMGEAVKVGDKFGLRITEMVQCDERFVPVRRSH